MRARVRRIAKSSTRRLAHHLFDFIVQDVGSDLAFTHATAIGVGSREPKAGLDCPVRLKSWETICEDYGLKGEE